MKTQIVDIKSPYAITTNNLSIIFNEKSENPLTVLQNFTYNFEKNKIYFIIGNSGSGKTSLISHFNGLLKSKHGDITVGDISILGKKKKIKHFKLLRRTCGMVFQFPEYQLFKDTIEKDIIFGPINLGEKKVEAKKKAAQYLKMVGLDESFLQRSPFELSGGQKRRVAIAGILSIEPEIIVFDEPTAGLDPAGEKEMMRIVKDLNKQGKTIIIITHSMDQVLEYGDEVIVLDQQKIAASGKPYEIFRNTKLLNETTLDTPKVINVINELVKRDERFLKLYDYQPKNVEELASYITTILQVKHE